MHWDTAEVSTWQEISTRNTIFINHQDVCYRNKMCMQNVYVRTRGM